MKILSIIVLALSSFFAAPLWAANEIADIACETTATTGTGTINLAGALTGGYLGFLAAGVTTAASVPYHITDGGGSAFETGWGTFTDATPDTLSRVADWSTDGVGAELTLSGTSTVCIGPISSLFTGTKTAITGGSVVSGTESLTGALELATTTEANTGTDTARAVTAAGLLGAVAGKHSVWVPGGAMVPRTTAGCGVPTAYEFNSITTLATGCDTATDEAVQFTVAFPKSWDLGTVTAQLFWTTDAGVAAATIELEISCGSFANDAAINSSGLGTVVAITDTVLLAKDVHVSAESTAITCSNVADDTVTYFQGLRDISADNLTDDLLIIGLKVFYTTDNENDD